MNSMIIVTVLYFLLLKTIRDLRAIWIELLYFISLWGLVFWRSRFSS